MVMQSRINERDRKINDLAFAADIALLENNATQAQLQLDALKHNALQVGLKINIDKTVQMSLNANNQIRNDNLVVNGQSPLLNNFKYVGSYVGSTNKDIEARIGLTWSAFAKLKPILTSPNSTVKLKICLFKATCTAILL